MKTFYSDKRGAMRKTSKAKLFISSERSRSKRFNTFYIFLASVFSLFLTCLIVFLFNLNFLQHAKATATYDYYGGKISKVTYCTCWYSPGVVIEVDDKTTNQTIKLKYSAWEGLLRANYSIWTKGNCVIGGMLRSSPSCQDTSGYTCKDNNSVNNIDGSIDYIRGIGSSSTQCEKSSGGGGGGGGGGY